MKLIEMSCRIGFPIASVVLHLTMLSWSYKLFDGEIHEMSAQTPDSHTQSSFADYIIGNISGFVQNWAISTRI